MYNAQSSSSPDSSYGKSGPATTSSGEEACYLRKHASGGGSLMTFLQQPLTIPLTQQLLLES
jgi:hypothetical protein